MVRAIAHTRFPVYFLKQTEFATFAPARLQEALSTCTQLLAGYPVFNWHSLRELPCVPRVYWCLPVCLCCTGPVCSLLLWAQAPWLWQTRLQVLGLGFLKTAPGFVRRWFGVFKSSCVPSRSFLSDVVSQCPGGLNPLFRALWSQCCCLLSVIGISWKERKHWMGTGWYWTVLLS